MDLDTITALPTSSFLPVLLLLFPLLAVLLLRHPSPRRLPPSPPSLPLIGHLHHLLSSPSPPHHLFARLAADLNTDILLLRLGRVPTVVVSSPSLACEVLKTNDHALASRPALLSAQYLSFGCSDVTFSPLGAYWRQARRICVSELLSPRRVASFGAIRRREVGHLLQSLVAGPGEPSSREVNMSERIFKLANDVLCRVAFGRRFEKKEGEEGGKKKKKKKGLVEVLEETQRLFAGFDAGEFFPGLVGEVVNAATGLRGRLERNLADLRAVCDEIIREHLEAGRGGGGDEGGGGGEEREDFVDVLLRVQKGGGLEVPITDDNLKALVLDMFVAGTDTTSATLEWVMTELARHPRVLHKAQAEVRAAAGSNKGTVDEDDLPGLLYLKAVVKEALRVHPPAPLLVPRESVEACSLGGYAVPARTRVLVNTYAMGRDPRVWEDPLEFRPERFEAGDGDGGDVKGGQQQDFRLLPFGGGRRGCPGFTFALATIELALAKLLFHYDWRLPDGVRAEDVDLGEVFGLATRKKTPLVLVATMNPNHMLFFKAGPSSESE